MTSLEGWGSTIELHPLLLFLLFSLGTIEQNLRSFQAFFVTGQLEKEEAASAKLAFFFILALLPLGFQISPFLLLQRKVGLDRGTDWSVFSLEGRFAPS